MIDKPINSIEKSISFIESNLKSIITLDDLSKSAGISKYHLDRVFKTITNVTPMEYIRRRKLSSSIHELLNSNLKIIDIAFEYGFKYEQSYIRAFINLFKISPDRLRKERSTIEITDKYNFSSSKPVGEDGLIVEPRIIVKPTFKIVGIEYSISISENYNSHIMTKLANDFFYNHRKTIKNLKHPNVYLGYIHYSDLLSDHRLYITCAEVSKLNEIPDGMEGYRVPTKKYAAFKYIGFHHPNHTTISHIKSIYNFIFKQWIFTSNYQISDHFHIERVDTDVARKDYCELEIYIPVELKA